MDTRSSHNVSDNHGNRNTRIPVSNFHDIEPLTTSEIEAMRGQPVYSYEAGFWGKNPTNHISSVQDLQGINQTNTVAERAQQQQLGQRQPADRSPANSSVQNHHPVSNQSGAAEQLQHPAIYSEESVAGQPDDRRNAKREADHRYKEKVKKQRMDMELKVTELEARNKYLEGQLDFANQKFATQQKELDKLKEDFVELKKKNDKEHEKYIELLRQCNRLVNPRSGTRSNALGRQDGETIDLSSD